jgi:ubiquinone/menaquinone biosynthesis C-methylase UbiE
MIQTDTFDPFLFERLKKAEAEHFWFKIRRKWIFDKIKKHIAPPAKFLEIGCGIGNVSAFLAQKGYSVTGCEYHQEAISMAWPGFQLVQCDANRLPFDDRSFDIAGLFDVIEHFQDDISLLGEAFRIVKDGGIIAITVPARPEAWSCFDEISLHKRRYTKEGLKKALSSAKLNPLLIEYMFMSLYLPMRYMRVKSRDDNDLFKINKSFNALLKGLFNLERIISKGLPLPIGTSLIAIARKEP